MFQVWRKTGALTVSFKDNAWSSRFDAMGDEAEKVFEAIHHLGWTRYGLNRPPVQMHKLPARIRYTPDYLTTNALIEVQGFGRDQVLKLKIDKWMSLHWWNSVMPVEMFVWDTTNQRWCFIKLSVLDDLLGEGDVDVRKFPEGKSYMAFAADAIFAASHRQGVVEEDAAS